MKHSMITPLKWQDKAYRRLTWKEARLYDYLIEWRGETISGIFCINPESVSITISCMVDDEGIGKISPQEIESILLGGKLPNVLYNKKTKFVFLKRSFKYNTKTGGNPHYLGARLRAEYEDAMKTGGCRAFWNEFASIYPGFAKYLKGGQNEGGNRGNTKTVPGRAGKGVEPGKNLNEKTSVYRKFTKKA